MTTRRLTIWMLSLASATLATGVLSTTMAFEKAKMPVLTVLERAQEPLLKADRPWEAMGIGINQVLRIGDQWHLWYAAYDETYTNDGDCCFCYARSRDGAHWEKPSLGLYSYKGNTDNNILLFGYNFTSFIYDETVPPAERFRAVGATQRQTGTGPVNRGGPWWVFGATSPDGLRWTLIEEPLLKKNSDTWTICLHDGDIYRLYVRMWTGSGDFQGNRVVGYSESGTFGAFSDPVEILAADKDDPADMQFYNSATTKLNDNLYLMFPSGYFTGSETAAPYAAYSRDGKKFFRLGHSPILGLGEGFDNQGIYVVAGAIPADQPGTYWIYYSGSGVRHDATVTEHHFNGGLGRFLLKVVD